MSKLSIIQLHNAIGREEFDHNLLSSALAEYEAVDQKINQLLKSGEILRIKKGLYVFGDDARRTPVCRESLANLIFGPSCISMEYALAFHGIIPERVETITSVTPKRNKEFNTPIGRFTYRYLAPEKYPHEIEQHWVDRLHPILIASAEKALCDYVVLNNIDFLANSQVAKNFLLDDLRIDKESCSRLDVRKLIKLNKHYNSKSISYIMEAL